MTTANAKLSTACEHAERCRRRLTGAMARMLNEFGLVDESQAVKQRSLLEFERDEEAV